MQTTLVTTGLLCVIAAIVGGGLKGFNIEIPGIASVRRQVLLGSFGLVLVGVGLGDQIFKPGEPDGGLAKDQDASLVEGPERSPGPTEEVFAIAGGSVVDVGKPKKGAGEIAVPGQVDVYSFRARDVDAIFVEGLALNGHADCQPDSWLVFELYDPENQRIGKGYFDEAGECGDKRFELPRNGSYELRIKDGRDADETGTYKFKLWYAPEEEYEIGIGSTVKPGSPGPGAGQIKSPGQIDVYRFNGTAGQAVFVDGLALNGEADCQPDSWLVFELYDPENQRIGKGYFDDGARCGDGRFELPRDGPYELRVQDGRGKAETGEYSFRIN